ncbi:hypothetical protein OGAPHI_002110 [Ogataea philodendri]|uniref:Uncharacterized protein n=1 Tax=Ogataea philodendri TaxID=1378263 RepID=A0A9P8T702_9ASCO|nr:uncharacterized protein OGAPHI_002110 [Ogataea philodendri]KAH3668356.1 hypothetical protein OGAPHI_002110 [Ogataea philodendri]
MGLVSNKTQHDKVGVQTVDTMPVLFCLNGTSEPSGTLLIHLGSWGDTIDCHVEHLVRLDDVEQMVDIGKNSPKHLIVGHSQQRTVIRMRTCVQNRVHVKIQVIKLWDWSGSVNFVGYQRPSLRDKPEKLRDT